MAEYAVAVSVRSVEGSLLTDDGNTALIKIVDADGAEQILAFPVTQTTLRLVDSLCGALGKAMDAQGVGRAIAVDASRFELGRDESGLEILGLTFGSGGKIWFRLPSGMAKNMDEVLGVVTGRSMPPKPDKPVN